MTEKNLGGRPEIELTEKQIKKVERLSAHLTTEQIADYFGIDRSTFYEIRKRQPEVSQQYKKGRAQKILKLSKKIENKSMGIDETGCATSLIFSLKALGEWSEKQVVETKDTTPLKKEPRQINIYVNEKPAHRLED
jgi:IS30 family transposase